MSAVNRICVLPGCNRKVAMGKNHRPRIYCGDAHADRAAQLRKITDISSKAQDRRIMREYGDRITAAAAAFRIDTSYAADIAREAKRILARKSRLELQRSEADINSEGC